LLKLLCNFHVNDINNKDFTVACAAGANRPVRAKCLVKGIRAPIEEAWLTILVHKLDGDVGQYLLQCVAAESFDVADEAYILYAIVLWAKKSGGRYALPPQVLQRGRALLRKDLDRQALAALMAVALDAADESFLELVSKADSRKAQTAMEQEQQGFSRLGEDRLRPRDSWSSSTRHGISPDTPETAKTLRTFFAPQQPHEDGL
jgi:hypothetical protein